MTDWNYTDASAMHFVFVGIPGLQEMEIRMTLFVFFLAIYIITLIENFFFLLAIKLDHTLQSPMYLFICNLAILDILIPSVTIPEMLYFLIVENGTIAFGPCIMQMYFYLSLLITESFTLVAMAYDRYQAICNPLHYATIMTTNYAFALSALCWTIGIMRGAPYVYFVLTASFCGPKRIEYFCCDYSSIILLACTDVTIQNASDKIISLIIISVQLFLVLFSYGKIISAVLRISSFEGQRKAFSTCASHPLVISVFYLIIALVLVSYAVPGFSEQVRSLAAIVQNIIPSLVNPIIYCIKTKEIRVSIIKLINKYKLGSLCFQDE
ncbi:olfactory receptor 6B1-like [Protopterus annectens]|uniref:olfactory receptor 6B1-like n=1 Tax=Protopterus annectens TaxID=7888 RepID=UPI001CFA9C46|nr:olfactory receptor 6B1-like [Protopterus annectens]